MWTLSKMSPSSGFFRSELIMDRLWFTTTKNDKSKNKHLFAGDRSIDWRVDPLQPIESSAAKVTSSPLQIFTDLADCLIPAIGQPFHSFQITFSEILEWSWMSGDKIFFFPDVKRNEQWDITKAWRRLRRKILGSENSGENQVSMSLLPTSKLHCKIFE